MQIVKEVMIFQSNLIFYRMFKCSNCILHHFQLHWKHSALVQIRSWDIEFSNTQQPKTTQKMKRRFFWLDYLKGSIEKKLGTKPPVFSAPFNLFNLLLFLLFLCFFEGLNGPKWSKMSNDDIRLLHNAQVMNTEALEHLFTKVVFNSLSYSFLFIVQNT